MVRDFDGLGRQRFDLLVVGGGIHGLFTAYDAAQRGWSVALVERGDFGGGLSFNHQRTIHGGLRSLQQGNLRKAARQIAERRTWARIAPHLVRPLPFIMGTHQGRQPSRLALRVGFALYDRLGRARNQGVAPELRLPNARLESPAATRGLFPGIRASGLTGGALWYDYQAHLPDRLTWTVALAADKAGAALTNYAEALGPIRSGDRITGARVRDELTGQEVEVGASVTVLAAGSALGSLMEAFGVQGAPPLVRAMNLLLDRPARDLALAARGRTGRMLTAVPWAGYVLVGTDQSNEPIPFPEARPPQSAVEAFLGDANAAFPALAAGPRDIRLVHHGLTPAAFRRGRFDLLPESRVLTHQGPGVSGLVSIVGVKYTTARATAQQAVDAAAVAAGRPAGGSRTGTTLLPSAEIADVSGRLMEAERALGIELHQDVRGHLGAWYGTEAPEVLRSAAAGSGLTRLSGTSGVMEGEVAYAVDRAQAVRLSDVVLRRTPLGSAGHPGKDALTRAAAIMAQPLGWDAARVDEEVRLVERVYPTWRE